MVGEVKQQDKQQEAPGLSPWDVLVWKLDSLDKRLDGLDQGLNRRIEALDQGLNRRIDRLEERTDREFTALRGEIGGLHGQMGDLRGEMGGLRGEMGGLRGEFHQELRSTRHSFVILELTAVLGFLAMLVSIWLMR